MLDATSQVDSTRMVPPAATPSAPPKPAYVPPGMEDTTAVYTPSGKPFKAWGEDGFTFGDILDIVNPLQHIPIVSTIYRAITGDSISPISRVVGDTLFTGPIGTALAMVNTAVEHETGGDIGDNVYAFLTDRNTSDPSGAKTAVAANEWKNPDLQPLAADTKSKPTAAPASAAPLAAFVAPGKPDLGVLSAFDTASGPAKAAAKIEPIAMQPRAADAADDDGDDDDAEPAEVNQAAAAPQTPEEAAKALMPQNTIDSWKPHAQALVPRDVPKGAERTMRNLYTQQPPGSPIPPPPPTLNDQSVQQLEQQTKSAEDAQNDWVAQKMMMALDKYSQAQKLRTPTGDGSDAASAGTTTDVTR